MNMNTLDIFGPYMKCLQSWALKKFESEMWHLKRLWLSVRSNSSRQKSIGLGHSFVSLSLIYISCSCNAHLYSIFGDIGSWLFDQSGQGPKNTSFFQHPKKSHQGVQGAQGAILIPTTLTTLTTQRAGQSGARFPRHALPSKAARNDPNSCGFCARKRLPHARARKSSRRKV